MMIKAELIGDLKALACGHVVVGSSPLLGLCRKLVSAGHDPRTLLEAYRDSTLCLTVRSIGEVAGLEVAAHGVGFRKRARPNEDGAAYSDLNAGEAA
jgi:hypothetical protein